MIERTTEMVQELRIKRYSHVGRHIELRCEDCGKTQYENITHVVTERPVMKGGFVPCAEIWLCEKCRSHRGGIDWVAPVADERSRLFGMVQGSQEAASSYPSNT